MADPPHTPDNGLPRWVKVAGIIFGILVLLLVVLALFGDNHGPGRHASADLPEFWAGPLWR